VNEIKKWMLTAVCPECQKVGTIRSILRGMPSGKGFELAQDEQIILGGCLIEPGRDYPHGCLECDWEGRFKNGKLAPNPLDTLDPDSVEYFEELMRQSP